MSTTKIAVLPSASRGGNFFRLFEPLRLIEKYGVEYNIIDASGSEDETYQQLIGHDFLFTHMPSSIESANAVLLAKALGIKAVVTVDDYVWKIPKQHPQYARWMGSGNEVLSQACHLADHVITTTQDIAQLLHLEQLIVQTAVAPLFVPQIRFPNPKTPPRETGQFKLLLRYGQMAEHDWAEHKEDLLTLAKNHHLMCVGGCPDWLREHCDLRPGMPTVTYFKFLHAIRPDLILYPIDRTLQFNRLRGIAAYPESVFCGAALVTNALIIDSIWLGDLVEMPKEYIQGRANMALKEATQTLKAQKEQALHTYLNIFK